MCGLIGVEHRDRLSEYPTPGTTLLPSKLVYKRSHKRASFPENRKPLFTYLLYSTVISSLRSAKRPSVYHGNSPLSLGATRPLNKPMHRVTLFYVVVYACDRKGRLDLPIAA